MSGDDEHDELVRPQLEAMVAKILKNKAYEFVAPGCLLLLEGNFIYVQLVVD